VAKIRNPASTKRSSEFVEIYHATKQNQKVAAYTSQTDKLGQPKVYIANEKAAALQGLSRESIHLPDDAYSAVTEYAITFTPFSWSKTNPTLLQLSYPVTVAPSPAGSNGGCSTWGGGASGT
jgi:hypothetical protein